MKDLQDLKDFDDGQKKFILARPKIREGRDHIVTSYAAICMTEIGDI